MKIIIVFELFVLLCFSAFSQSIVELPYETSFESETNFENEWVIENINSEGDSPSYGFWIYSPDYFGIDESGSVVFISSSTNPADDWLISPGFNLEPGIEYSLNFAYASLFSGYPASLEVYLGNSNSYESMNVLVNDFGAYDNTDFSIYSTSITVETSGTYYIGFHDYSPIGGYGGETIDDFSFIQTPMGINDISVANSIEIYPNPTTNFVYVNQEYLSYKIYSIDGKLIQTGNYEQKISLDNFNDGVFFLILECDNQTFSSYRLFVNK
ncbi:MAG: hypothetical protein C0596_01720 [Marinilabiliales bacterium]|nr:MAG: hypothetical protein C0596_01720 [Marinilabiliales bacterium]